MKWKKLRLETTTAALDYLGAVAMELGLEGFEIEDNVPLTEEEKEKMFIDILPELPEDKGIAFVSFYVDPDTDEKELEFRIRESVEDYSELCDFGAMTLEVSLEDDNNWINNWKEFFKPFRIDDNIVIKPTWEEYVPDDQSQARDEIVIEIDPGTAFGTGAHETTKLCILALKKYMKNGDRVLDLGCGSGILSIAAMKLGADSAFGVDIDEIAVDTSVENASVNNIPAGKCEKTAIPESGKMMFIKGNVLSDNKLCSDLDGYDADIVVANILADVIIPLSDKAGSFMKKGGLFISSGIINTKEEAVKEAILKNGFEIAEILHMNDWVSIVARKPN
ncbi:MAG: 50S ribosomal protein L11 methyltransferase [Lachnospiraceae bacterium]|nr:50S ribosomal protein L11 methyltransferase [Lachnospiraceae bacterium]